MFYLRVFSTGIHKKCNSNHYLLLFNNSGVVIQKKLPDPSLDKVFNLLSIGLRYTLSFRWSDFGVKYVLTAMLKGQPPNFKASVWKFSISETGSKCNSVFRHADSNWVILWNFLFQFLWASLCFKECRSLPWTWDRVRYYNISIATGVTSEFLKIFDIFLFDS